MSSLDTLYYSKSYSYQPSLILKSFSLFFIQCPSTLAEEKQYNPFLRSHSQDLHRALGLQQNQDEDWTSYRARVLEELRRRKDIYKGR